MPFGKYCDCQCVACGEKFNHTKRLSEHIKKQHGLNSEQYTVKHFYDGVRPTCPECGELTRFVAIGEFRRYCKNHAKIAMSLGGTLGGHLATPWNKGKTKETDPRIAEQAAKSCGENNPFYGKSHTPETLRKISESKTLDYSVVKERIIESAPDTILLSSPEDYVDQYSLLKLQCKNCNTITEMSSYNIQRCYRCKTCYPLASKGQLEVADYVKSLGFEVDISTRKVISPLELDVYVPSKNLAIEYHGLFWHSGGKNGVFDKGRHRLKYKTCLESHVRLIQIFSDEWDNKQQICKSIILNALGVNPTKLNARDCSVKVVTHLETKTFLNENHLYGSTRAKLHLGLYHKSLGLVGVATVRTPIQKKWGKVCELARMAFCQGMTIRGGAGKLLSYIKDWSLQNGYEGVLSYAELRYGEGGVYEKCGFSLVGESTSNYWYTDGVSRFDRFAYRAQPGKTEKEVAEAANVKAVWGAGNKIYVWKPCV